MRRGPKAAKAKLPRTFSPVFRRHRREQRAALRRGLQRGAPLRRGADPLGRPPQNPAGDRHHLPAHVPAATQQGKPHRAGDLDRTVTHVVDGHEDPDVPEASRNFARLSESRSGLVVPMLRDGHPLGCITVARAEARPFTESQILLLKTFAHRAVIAIENVRLFNEAAGPQPRPYRGAGAADCHASVLRAISGLPMDTQPIFDMIAESAARLCEAHDAVVCRVHDGYLGGARRRRLDGGHHCRHVYR